MHSPVLDYAAVTQQQQATWAKGDFHEIARQIMWVSEDLCRAVDPRAAQSVLDVACGSGNAALIAARRYCEVAGIDYVPALIERAKMRAHAEDTPVDFRVADAQSLPFDDASFDHVLSVFGVMFAPNQALAARELLRVCKSEGRIGLCTWMPEEFGGDFFAVHARHMPPPPPGLMPPTRWGTAQGLRELLGEGTRSIQSERLELFEYFRSTDHAIDTFARFFGPTARTLEGLDTQRQRAFRQDLREVLDRYNVAEDGTYVLKAQYLRTVAVKR